MTKPLFVALALASALFAPLHVSAADEPGLAALRAEIEALRKNYETRITALEERLKAAEQGAKAMAAVPPVATPSPVAATRFNPELGLVLGGRYARLSQDPSLYRLQGFFPAGEGVGPGARSFNLGESELTLTANIDPNFSGKLVLALGADNSAEVEEAFVQTSALPRGLKVRAGRFLSSVGYLNSKHAHTWDFVDAPLAYQAFFGGQFKPDGIDLRWLAPTEKYLELGLEAGNGTTFPGSAVRHNGSGVLAVHAHLADDIGDAASWRAGLSWLSSRPRDRRFEDLDASGTLVSNAFSGRSRTLVADAVYKWAPAGNATQRNFKLQGEYFRRTESGELSYDVDNASLGSATDRYRAVQTGWYLQGVYQFEPRWRVGLRWDRLDSGTARIGLIDNAVLAAADLPALAAFKPRRGSLMFDYSPSEFSRLRLQFARDQTRPGVSDNQIFLQYIMSLGAHGAHAF